MSKIRSILFKTIPTLKKYGFQMILLPFISADIIIMQFIPR